MNRDEFLEAAKRRIANLSGDALAAELDKLRAEMEPIIAAEVAEHGRKQEERIASMRRQITKLIREQAATDFVKRIRRPGIELHVLLPLVLERFEVREDGEGDAHTVTAKGADGQPVTLDVLAEEFRANPAFAPLVHGASEAENQAHKLRVAETLGERLH